MTTPVDLGNSLSSMGDATNAQTLAALKVKGKAKAASHEFEGMFINSMFQEMLTGVDGDGPLGGSGALKVWRSFMVNQYAQLFAKNGGLGIASHVYDELLKHQGLSAS
jgi:Rod binding domain-containing protein